MSNNDRVEYYVGTQLRLAINSSIVPLVGNLINIAGKTWRVEQVSYAIDHSENPTLRSTCANVWLTETEL